ncbi:hypothetical protein EUBVEN_01474 [Eubacterium ventriosum ATCC 27560]|uniref:Uncharacterized protein n=1 Tax=Eubacterium ventriosum ATCC 27560 TaxID=411463 RepID=A5Z6Z1_9FIRM|nr:hypothetical protein EUBVEN_01474 [Eubacterium ventriosum ATCC 27560]
MMDTTVDIFGFYVYNISTKRKTLPIKQDMKHKEFASVVLATLKLYINSLAQWIIKLSG